MSLDKLDHLLFKQSSLETGLALLMRGRSTHKINLS